MENFLSAQRHFENKRDFETCEIEESNDITECAECGCDVEFWHGTYFCTECDWSEDK